MKTKVNVPRSGIVLSVVLQGLLFSGGAEAAQSVEAGLLQLPNVKIQSATPQQVQAIARQGKAASQSGVRAFKDKDTGRDREQTPEEMVEDGAASAAAPAPSATIFSPVKGGVAALLDENYLSNAVVTKGASGKLDMECVTGTAAANKALAGGNSKKEHRHDH